MRRLPESDQQMRQSGALNGYPKSFGRTSNPFTSSYTELDSYWRFGSLRLFAERLFAESFFELGLRFEPIAFR
jgi:hypothetical protein